MMVVVRGRCATVSSFRRVSLVCAAVASHRTNRTLCCPPPPHLQTPLDHLETEAYINTLAEAGLKPQRPGKAARWMTGNRFRKVADRIEADLGSNLSVAVLAQEIGVSASFLSRAFSAYCGQSPYDYIVSRRLQRARALIVSTGKPLAEIALRSGFSSQSHMTASFRTRLGVSPSKFARPDR